MAIAKQEILDAIFNAVFEFGEGEKWEDQKIADAFYVSILTVQRTRQSLVEKGLENTLNRQPPKASKRRIIHGEEEAHLVAMACSEPPEGHCRWTVRLLADKMVELEYLPSVSHMTVHNALKKTKLSLGKKKNGASLQNPMQNLSVKWKKS
jgi:transposase